MVLARLRSPLTRLLAGDTPEWSGEAAVTVVVAAPGYPGSPQLGGTIGGLTEAAAVPGVTVLHAGTKRVADGRVVSTGGRVLSVTGTGPDLRAARESVYDAVARITLDGAHHRTDIADPARLARLAAS